MCILSLVLLFVSLLLLLKKIQNKFYPTRFMCLFLHLHLFLVLPLCIFQLSTEIQNLIVGEKIDPCYQLLFFVKDCTCCRTPACVSNQAYKYGLTLKKQSNNDNSPQRSIKRLKSGLWLISLVCVFVVLMGLSVQLQH